MSLFMENICLYFFSSYFLYIVSLRSLARRMAAKVQKYKKSVMLEPMNPYERRIIHSEIQNIEGVSTNSIGSENNRRIVIFLDDTKAEA